MALSSIFLIFVILLLVSSLLKSCLFLDCMFLSLVISFVIFICHCPVFLFYFFDVVDFLCIHILCSLPLCLLFLLLNCLFSTSSSFSSSPSFSFFSPFVYLLCQHDTPQKNTKPDFVLTDKTGPVLANFTNPIFYGKIWLYVAERKQILENPHLQDFRNIILWTSKHKISEAIEATHQKKMHQVPKPYFYCVLWFAPLHQNSTSREVFQPRCQNGPFFQTPHLHVQEHHHHNPHILRQRRVHFEQAQDLPNTYFYSARLTWLVG